MWCNNFLSPSLWRRRSSASMAAPQTTPTPSITAVQPRCTERRFGSKQTLHCPNTAQMWVSTKWNQFGGQILSCIDAVSRRLPGFVDKATVLFCLLYKPKHHKNALSAFDLWQVKTLHSSVVSAINDFNSACCLTHKSSDRTCRLSHFLSHS